ncbi:MFS transporter [Corynebacterium sp. TAE3-ERU16]|uniref:MFS transporter n=1 Tax=Corynebacterium sp. TAE3-ERU16 TaxID=2849493 RepID=UPI001C4589AA|nr:MFS transporter [Corynebacterium sp. TAE3-ERU16]MBV7292269.1 MFS transporter [Corynebacterium sp. TAE3-ERU16]
MTQSTPAGTDPTALAATASAVVPESADPRERRRAVLSSFLGSTVEYYDFLLYAAAAGLVFPKLFFGSLSPELGTTLSFLILLIGYISRPIGSMAFGHFGDKYGRKNVLVVTLLTMGLVSVTIGLMPSADKIGVAAPIILVVLRTVQGLAVGGEWAGATLMAMEHSKRKNKGFGASLAIAGGPAGAVLSTLVLAVFSKISGDNFANPERYFVTDWGWRVPFLFSAGIVMFGLYLRSRVTESPEFEAARREGRVHTGVPLVKMLQDSPRELVLGSLAGMAGLFIQGLQASFMVPYIVRQSADSADPISRGDALMMLTIGSVVAIFVMPGLAALSDRFGRRRVMLLGGLVSVVGLWIVLRMIQTGDPSNVWIGMILMVCVVQPAQYGPIGAFLSEKFDPAHRYTGAGITFQVSAILGAGTAPLVANRLMGTNADLTPVAIYATVLFIISSIAIYVSRETAHRETPEERFQETAVFKA